MACGLHPALNMDRSFVQSSWRRAISPLFWLGVAACTSYPTGPSENLSSASARSDSLEGDGGVAWAPGDPVAWFERGVLVPSDGLAGDGFGTTLAFDGNLAVIGAPGATVGANPAQGAAYVFTRSEAGWQETQKLVADAGAANDCFGSAVSVLAGTILVGAPGCPGAATAGSAHVFELHGATWTAQTIVAGDGATGDGFGNAVAVVRANRVLVGAPFAAIEANALQGAVYSWTATDMGWTQDQKIVAADGVAGDRFGTAVAATSNGDTVNIAMIGAPAAPRPNPGGSANPPSGSGGAVYAFDTIGAAWTVDGRLTATTDVTVIVSGFGSAVAISGTTAVIGAPKSIKRLAGIPPEAGAAFVFHLNSLPHAWIQTRAFPPMTTQPILLGYSVGCDGETVAVGVIRNGTVNSYRSFEGVDLQQTFTSASAKLTSQFGTAVGVQGDTLLVGAPRAAVGGAVYVEQSLTTNGTACSTDAACGSGHCVAGACCDRTCGACESCATGSCAVVAAGIAGNPSCGAYLCDGASADCPTRCNGDDGCIAGDYCHDGVCAVRMANGASCVTGNECASGRCVSGRCLGSTANGTPCTGETAFDCDSGYCVDGVCCNAPCTDSCEACDGDSTRGICSPVSGAPHGARAACAGAGTPCAGACDGQSPQCTYPTSTTVCASSCGDGQQRDDLCSGDGRCVAGTPHACADGFACANGFVCKTTCATTDDCAPGFVCADGACSADRPTCADEHTSQASTGKAEDCTPFRCSPATGMCKQGPCGSVDDCAAPYVCDAKGRCVAPPSASAVGCSCRLASRSEGGALPLLALAASLGAIRMRSGSGRRRRGRPEKR